MDLSTVKHIAVAPLKGVKLDLYRTGETGILDTGEEPTDGDTSERWESVGTTCESVLTGLAKTVCVYRIRLYFCP